MSQGGGKPRPYHTRIAAPIRSMVGAGLAPALANPSAALPPPWFTPPVYKTLRAFAAYM